ncbi:MAG: hypothetical protein QOI91_2447 [Solirubrobacteraceae bacterium]|jgi:hypothetical protein|nr:hypothetical protein [Solirubrobacteraceae bacterium]MDX6672084.1 hypothetical protein [Solirubrobacteraceae bacterium]
MAAKIVDFEILGELVLGAFAAGIGVSAVFGLVIYGSTRFADLRREGNAVGAGFFAAVAVLALLAFAGAVAFGLAVIIKK